MPKYLVPLLILVIASGSFIFGFEFNVNASIMFTLSSSPTVERFYSINGEFTFFELADVSFGVGGGVNLFTRDFLGEKLCFDVYSMSSYVIPLEKDTVLKLSGSGGMSFLGRNFENKGYFVRMEFDIFRRLGRFTIGLGGGLDQHGFENSHIFSFFMKINMGFGK